jgi:hypothetical protein
MTPKENLTPGGLANLEYVTQMLNEHPELADEAPQQCIGCSSGLQHTLNGHVERVKGCTGRTTRIIGKKVVGTCHLPSVEYTSED